MGDEAQLILTGLESPKARAVWERVIGAYEQCLNALWPNQDYLPLSVPAFLGELLARVSASYYGAEDQYIADAWRVITKVRSSLGMPEVPRASLYRDPLFEQNEGYRLRSGARRGPTPIEAAIETMRRLRDVRLLEGALAPVSLAAVLGGSVSYGRFLNVKGGEDASDLDLLIIIESFDKLESLLSAFAALPSIATEDVDKAKLRGADFCALCAGSEHKYIFSAKAALWQNRDDPLLIDCGVTSSYSLSVHVATRSGVGRLLLESAPIIVSSIIGSEETILDYRETKPARSDSQRSFSGRSKFIAIDARPHKASFVRETKIFVIDDDSYYPGMFQNLVLPAFDVRWGDSAIRRVVDAFRWKMIDRLRYEQQRNRANQLLRLSFAHTRSEVFAPHVIRSVDASTVLA